MLPRAVVASLLLLALAGPTDAAAESLRDLLKRSAEDALRKATQAPPAKPAPASSPSPAPSAAPAPSPAPATPTASESPAPASAPAAAPPPESSGSWPAGPAALRQPPTVAWATDLGFRDWGDLVLAGGVLVGSNSSGGGGLFAVDAATGKLRWKVPTSNKTGQAAASDGRFVVVPWTSDPSLAAYDLATGKLAWSHPFDPVDDGTPVIVDGLVIAQHENGFLYAYDVATGAERWKNQYARRENWCAAGRPAVADGVVYVSSGLQPPQVNPRADYFLHAIDARTGRELWRTTPLSRYPNNYGACLDQILVVGDTIVATADQFLFGFDRATGREKYRVETRHDGRLVDVRGLVQVGGHVYGVSEAQFWAIDASTGRTAWTLPGRYRDQFTGTAAADGVVYFQGRLPGADPANEDRGILNAVDVRTRQVLWSYAYPKGPAWPFDVPIAVDGALYVAGNKVLLKLQ